MIKITYTSVPLILTIIPKRTFEKIPLTIIIVFFGILIIPVHAATITWVNALNPNQGCANPGTDCDATIIEVDDPAANLDVGQIDQIQVNVRTSVDATGIILTLYETGVNTSIFRNENLALMIGNNVFSASDTVTITIYDPNGDPGIIDQLNTPIQDIFVISDLDTAGITPIFTETDIASNLYTAKIKFGASTDSGTNTIKATAGTIISVLDIAGGNYANGIIAPNPSDDKGAIRVEEGGTITAEYYDDPVAKNVLFDDETTPIGVYPGPGRGGGGLVAPSLVVDVVAFASDSSGGGNGCVGDCVPPTLGADDRYNRMVQNGFSYNDNPVDVDLFYTHYPLVRVNVGEENKAVLKIYENFGPENIEHIELGFGLASGEILSESKATILLDRVQNANFTISKFDPENVLENIKVETSVDICTSFTSSQCLVATIYHTFRAPLDFTIVATNVWDFDKNAWQNYYNDGVEIHGKSLNPPKEYLGIDKGRLVRLTEISKDSAVDENGDLWTYDKTWIKNFKIQKTIDEEPTSHGYNRNHDKFKEYKENQIRLAESKLKELLLNKTLTEDMSEPKSISITYISRYDNKKLQTSIIDEAKRAEKIIAERYFHRYSR